ncbi:hypothetical protein [Dysgonomonas sp. ZJ709]|uniref:hypothetical protein n=1 Tax=Dysgonomonas sp. ZJ709 TaxID=2709797 RepID=UPI0013EDE925|nr:hypothetical protein [Dysgonomonas sp. ZJ709]
MRQSAICLIILLILTTTTTGQTPTDSVKQGVRRYIARNFSEARTFNLYWEKTPFHDYTLMQNGKEIENGEFRHINTVKFSVTVPVLLLKNFSLYANGQFNSYQFEANNNVNGGKSAIFSQNDDGYNYYEGTLAGTYRTRIAGKPLILIATAFGDGWNKGFGKAQGIFSAIMIFKQSPTTSFSAGLFGMTLYEKIPVIPIIAYTHQFTPDWSIDLTLPSRSYIRYQPNNHRFSMGASLGSEHFYMKPGMKGIPEVSFFNRTVIKPEIVYEYIINKRFYLIARSGGSALISGGLYGTNRKGIDGDPYIKFKQPMTPFLNVGFSYNIF